MNYGYVEMQLGFDINNVNNVVTLVSKITDDVVVEYEVRNSIGERQARLDTKICITNDKEVNVNDFVGVINSLNLGTITKEQLDEIVIELKESGIKVRLNEYKPYSQEQVSVRRRTF